MVSIVCKIYFLCSVFVSIAQGQTFVDNPPPDYFKRSSLNDCVERFHNKSSLLITGVHNGDPVEPGEFSAFAALGWTRNNSQIDYLCGGALIALNYVITAAHCAVDGMGKQPDTVRFGDVDLSREDDNQNAQQIPIKRFIKHPNYKHARAYNDLALVELQMPIEPSVFVCTACLWTHMKLNFDSLTVMGFGVTEFASMQSPVLLKASLAPIDLARCQQVFPNNRKIPDGILDSQFCAGAPTKDACQGDSGGPILVELVDARTNKLVPFITGIVSLGNGCNDGSSGIYSRVASYIDWIESTTGMSFSQSQCAQDTQCTKHYKDTKSNVQRQVSSPNYHVRLLSDANSTEPFCGGALVDYRHVITSAECVSGPNTPTFVDVSGNKVAVAEIVVHPDYSSQSMVNNLALLTLEQFLDWETQSNYIQPACLWKKTELIDSDVFVSALELFDVGEDRRFIINSTLLGNDRCSSGLVCTENIQNVIPEICKYDLGAPVTNYVRNKNDKYIPFIYGVNSKGSGCGGKGNIFEATTISSNFNWIETTILKHVVNALNSQQDSSQKEFFLDSTCLPPTGGLGECVMDSDCRQLITDYRQDLNKIKICSFNRDRTVVCCPHLYM